MHSACPGSRNRDQSHVSSEVLSLLTCHRVEGQPSWGRGTGTCDHKQRRHRRAPLAPHFPGKGVRWLHRPRAPPPLRDRASAQRPGLPLPLGRLRGPLPGGAYWGTLLQGRDSRRTAVVSGTFLPPASSHAWSVATGQRPVLWGLWQPCRGRSGGRLLSGSGEHSPASAHACSLGPGGS